MKKHNGIISFWKFMFCIMIICFHGSIFANETTKTVLFAKGSIAVEFFFLVSGYLLCKSALKNGVENNSDTNRLGIDTFKFIIKKIKSFLPYILVFYLCGLITNIYYLKLDINDILLSVWDVLLLGIAGFRKTEINGVVWYIGAMLISMWVIYPLIRKYKYSYIYIIVPIIVIILSGWMSHEYINLRDPYQWTGFFNKGLIRAFIELNSGSLIYVLSEKIKQTNFTKLGQLFITVIEICGFILPFYMSQYMIKASRYDFIVLIILSMAISIAFSEKTLEYKYFCNKIVYFLERLSLPMFLSHIFIRTIIYNEKRLINFTYNEKMLILIFSTIVISLIVMLIVEIYQKNNISKKIKKKFISDKKRRTVG